MVDGWSTRTRARVGALAGLLVLNVLAAAPSRAAEPDVVVLVSADGEWKALLAGRERPALQPSPYGEWYLDHVTVAGRVRPVVFLHGGWGKIAAAASTQFAIDRWHPSLLVNLGTCGGFEGAIGRGEVVLVERTLVYDIVEQMGDAAGAIAAYTTPIDVSWVGAELPRGVRKGPMLSADRDILPADVPRLRQQLGGVAADWESGSIAWVARANHTPVLILRGVSDLVGSAGGEAYGNLEVFEAGARRIMGELVGQLPFWLERWDRSRASVAPVGSR